MQKHARKRSADPIQEKLREDKDQWNAGISVFIDDIKQFKKLMNGYASKFHMEKSKITEAIPGDPASILNELAGSFRDLAVKGNEIIQEQAAYSQNRRKKQPKTPDAGIPKPDLSKQLGASVDYLLSAEGSNLMTRWWSRLKLPWFSGPEKRKKEYRLQLLDTSVDLYKRYKVLQSDILRSSGSKLEDISKTITRIERDVSSMEADLIAYAAHTKKSEPETSDKEKNLVEKSKPISQNTHTKPSIILPDDKPINQELDNAIISPIQQSPIEIDESIIQAAKDAIIDVIQNKDAFVEIDGKLMKSFRIHTLGLEAIEQQPMASREMIEKYSKNLLAIYTDLVSDLRQKIKVPGVSLLEIKANRESKVASYFNNLETYANKIVNKRFEQLLVFGTSNGKVNRKDIFNISKNCLTITNSLMDNLENDLDVSIVSQHLKQLKDNNKLINTTFRSLKIKMQDAKYAKLSKGK